MLNPYYNPHLAYGKTEVWKKQIIALGFLCGKWKIGTQTQAVSSRAYDPNQGYMLRNSINAPLFINTQQSRILWMN